MQKERTTLKVAALLNNEGQLGWLPTNPRQWTKSDIDLTAQSLTNDPDFLEDRPLLVVPGPTAKSFIVFAGNLRLTAARQLKIKEVPGIIYTPENETDQLTIKRRSVLDNGAFGAWDYDALANEWDDLPLGDWGVPAWNNPADNLPEELADLDLTPDDLPKIQGSDETAMERIIICYRKADEDDLAAALGLEKIDKVVYDFAELKPGEAVQLAENEKNGEK